MRFRHLLPVAVLLCPLNLAAQTNADSATSGDSALVDSALVIHRVQLIRRDIFDPTERSWVARMGNKLHFQTRAPVIRREILLRPGQLYDSALVAESERNLRAMGIFRRVQIDSVRTDSGLVLQVVTKDGWSTQLDWRFRSTGGEVAFTLGMIETNLLGTASSAAIRYRNDPDRNSIALGFRRRRLFAGTIGLELGYENRSDGRLSAVAIERPFFSTTSANAFRLSLVDDHARVLRFFEGEDLARDTLSRRFSLARASYAWALRAATTGYLRLGVTGQIRRDDTLRVSSVEPFPRNVTGAIGSYVIWNRSRFLVTQGFAGFAREEDVDVGTTLRIGLQVAPGLFGYERDGLGPEVSARVGSRIPGGFGYLDGFADGLFTSAGLDSGTVQVGGTIVLQPAARHLAVFHLEGGWLEDPVPGEEFDLGLGSGPRAFGSHSFTGDRSFFTTAEYRYTMVDDLWGQAGIGLAGFVDYGGAWYSGSPRRTGWDAGVGLRLGASRSTDVPALRFDLAHRFANDVDAAGWVITIGKGFGFGAPTRGLN